MLQQAYVRTLLLRDIRITAVDICERGYRPREVYIQLNASIGHHSTPYSLSRLGCKSRFWTLYEGMAVEDLDDFVPLVHAKFEYSLGQNKTFTRRKVIFGDWRSL